jgi:hypothetical protein
VRWIAAFVAWTLLVWTGRVRNIVADDALDAGGTTWRLALALTFVIGSVIVAVLLVRSRRRPVAAFAPTVRALAAFTVVVWVVRAAGILVADHEAAFKVVHTVLAVGSIGLAVLAVLAVREVRAGGATGDGEPPVSVADRGPRRAPA